MKNGFQKQGLMKVQNHPSLRENHTFWFRHVTWEATGPPDDLDFDSNSEHPFLAQSGPPEECRGFRYQKAIPVSVFET